MKFNFRLWILLIYLSFALDSALKLDIGSKVHVGIAAILATNVLYLLTKPSLILKTITADYFFVLILAYCTLNGLILSQPGFLAILTYLLLALNVYIYVSATFKYWDIKFFYYFQIILIATGLLQYLAFKIMGIQFSFIDAEHYAKGSSVSHRLRGFFVEPNWFAIAFTFNTLLLANNRLLEFIRKHPWIATLTCIVMILNGSLATIGILAIIYSIPMIKKNPVRGSLIMLLMLSIMAGVFSFRGSINQKGGSETALNYNSRWIPFVRVIDYQTSHSLGTMLFGSGLGSWGTLAVNNRLSALVFEEDIAARDGSELPVIIFELGVFGLVLLLLDTLILFFRCPKSEFHIRGGIILFFICLVFYPTLKFWMYMPYYFYMRKLSYSAYKLK